MFKDIFIQGLPNFWDEEGVCTSESYYHLKLQEKINDITAIDNPGLIIRGQDIFDILDKYFFLFHKIRKLIFGLPPPSYNFYLELDVISREMLATTFPAKSVW